MDTKKKHTRGSSESKTQSQPVGKKVSDGKDPSLKRQLKAVILSDCKFEQKNRPLPDPNKVNELDCLNNMNQSKPYPFGKTFLSQIMKTQFKLSRKKSPQRSFKEKNSTPARSKRQIKKPKSDSEDDTLSHVKSIANCLLENTLNKLDIKESSRLIADHIDDPAVETPETSSNFQILESNSREALYDPNSQLDLLDDFNVSPLLEGFNSVHTISVNSPVNNVVFLGMRPLNEEESVIPDTSIFPSWLLRILRNNFPDNNQEINNDWAYCYSQGDGWGNNQPWILRNDDDSEEASSESSSVDDSLSVAEADTLSSVQDINPLPDDTIQPQFDHIRLYNDQSDEYFDTSDAPIVPQ